MRVERRRPAMSYTASRTGIREGSSRRRPTSGAPQRTRETISRTVLAGPSLGPTPATSGQESRKLSTAAFAGAKIPLISIDVALSLKAARYWVELIRRYSDACQYRSSSGCPSATPRSQTGWVHWLLSVTAASALMVVSKKMVSPSTVNGIHHWPLRRNTCADSITFVARPLGVGRSVLLNGVWSAVHVSRSDDLATPTAILGARI